MNFNWVQRITGLFASGAMEPESYDMKPDASYLLGRDAAQIYEREKIGVIPRDVYQHRYDDANAKLQRLVKEGSFNYDNFNVGFESQIGIPYDQGIDVLLLKKKLPQEFVPPVWANSITEGPVAS